MVPLTKGFYCLTPFVRRLSCRLGGVGRLTGYARNLRSFLLHRAVKRFVPSLEKRHHLYSYLRLVEAMGIEMEPLDELLAIPPPPTPNAGNAGSEIHLGICPGAEYGNAKRYPIERYAEAIGNLRANRPDLKIRVSIFGSPVERQIGEDLAALIAEPRVNRAGQTSIAGLMTELQSCHLVVTNDTGSMHLAAALGVPTVAIFGSTEPDLTAPIGAIHRVIRHKVDCSPCFLRDCPIDYRCMLRIEPAQVVREMEVLLEAAK